MMFSKYLLLILLQPIIINCKQSNFLQVPATSPDLKIVTGLYGTDLPDPIWYETYIPAVLSYKTPKFNKTEITFNNWYKCTSEKYPYSLSCPTVFHLNRAIENLHGDFESIRPGSVDVDTSQENYFFKLREHESFCHKIQDHFPEFYVRDDDYTNYLYQLKSCRTTERMYVEKDISDFVYDIRQPFSKMETNFYETFYKPVTQSNQSFPTQRLLGSAVLSNSRTAVQGSVLATFYANRNRWTFATIHCMMKLLPPSLVSGEKLDNILKVLNSTVSNSSFQYSIPVTTLSKYFQIPLTDCTHTTNDLVVRLLIPLLRQYPATKPKARATPFLLRTVQTLKFRIGNQFCELDPTLDGTKFVYHSLHKIAYRSICEPNQLCDVSLYSRSGKEDRCVSSAFAGNIEGVKKYCSYNCYPIENATQSPASSQETSTEGDKTSSTHTSFNAASESVTERLAQPANHNEHHGTMLRRIGSNRIIIATSGWYTAVNIVCTGEHQDFLYDLLSDWQSETNGAVEIQFLCDCKLIVQLATANEDQPSTVAMNSVSQDICTDSNSTFKYFRLLPWNFVDLGALALASNSTLPDANHTAAGFNTQTEAEPIYPKLNAPLSSFLNPGSKEQDKIVEDSEINSRSKDEMLAGRDEDFRWIWTVLAGLFLLNVVLSVMLLMLFRKLRHTGLSYVAERGYSVSFRKETEMTEQLIQ